MVSGPVALLLLAVAVAMIVIGTSKYKINAFLVLIFVSAFYAFAIGVPPARVMVLVREGFGGLITRVGLIYLGGTIMGSILEKSGAAVSITEFILKLVGKKNAPLAIGFSGYVVSIPINCDPGFIILTPVNRGLSMESGYSMTTMSVTLAGGLLSTHAMVPPTAGPLAVALTLSADLAQVIVFGLIASFFCLLVAWLWAVKFCAKYKVFPEGERSYSDVVKEFGKLPNVFHSLLPILYPLTAICLASFANMKSQPFGDGVFASTVRIMGDAPTALLCAVLIAFTLVPVEKLGIAASTWVSDALKDAALIMFVTAAGGAFGAVLAASPMVGFIEEVAKTWRLGLFLPFFVTAILKVAQGSSTVAMITTSAIMAPLIDGMGLHPAIVAVSIGAGSMIVSHTNDSYFWVVTQFSKFEVGLSLKTYTAMTGLIGITAFLVINIINIFV
ncbi:MAG: GntP family permease [Planctomycetes bacterium]|nr:GntP family permease [Planctomycetota bacterium]